MVRFVLLVIGLMIAGGVALYLIHARKLRTILHAREEEDE